MNEDGVLLGRVGRTDRTPDMESIDRDKCRTSMQKIVDLNFDVVDVQ